MEEGTTSGSPVDLLEKVPGLGWMIHGSLGFPTVDGLMVQNFQVTTHRLDDLENPVHNGINYQPQLVSLPDFWTINRFTNGQSLVDLDAFRLVKLKRSNAGNRLRRCSWHAENRENQGGSETIVVRYIPGDSSRDLLHPRSKRRSPFQPQDLWFRVTWTHHPKKVTSSRIANLQVTWWHCRIFHRLKLVQGDLLRMGFAWGNHQFIFRSKNIVGIIFLELLPSIQHANPSDGNGTWPPKKGCQWQMKV